MLLNNYDIKIIQKNEKGFPKQLYDLNDCPKQLYTIGNINLLSKFSIAIVGARACLEESAKYAKKISYGLAQKGIVIISGLAYGIDSIAHKGCLEANGKTIAVLGGGFNDIYPKENIGLLYNILEKEGLIISEYEPDAPPLRHHFLQRNRIVAALSKGVVLIEAKENSGSITTAKHALNLKRKLFVIPGSITEQRYTGSNRLLTKGAKCILSYEDVIMNYKKFSKEKRESNFEKEILNIIPKEYEKIYIAVSNKPKTINQLSIELNMSMPEISSKLTFMEMEGYIKQLPGKFFVKN